MGRIFKAMMEHPGPNDVWLGTVNGVTVVSYFKDLHQTGVEAERVMGSGPRPPATRNQIENLHRLAARVQAFYGDEAIGTLPPLKQKRQRRKAA